MGMRIGMGGRGGGGEFKREKDGGSKGEKEEGYREGEREGKGRLRG